MKFVSFFIDGSSISSVILEKKGNQYTIFEKAIFDLAKDLIALRHYIQYIKYTMPDCAFVTGLDIKDVSLKKGKIPQARGKELKELLNFELEKHNVFSKEESISSVSLFLDSKKDPLQQVYFSTCSKKSLESHVLKFKELTITPDAITTVAQAIFRYCQQNVGLDELLAIDYSQSIVRMVFIFSKKIEKICEISLEKYPIETTEFWQECDKFFFRCFTGFQNNMINVVFLKNQLPWQKLSNLLKEHDIEASIHPIDETLKTESERYSIPIGMCLDAAKEDKQSINFTYKKAPIFRSYEKTLKRFAFSMMTIALLFGVFSNRYFSFKEQRLDAKICGILDETAGHEKYNKTLLNNKDAFEKAQLLEKQVRLLKKNSLAQPFFSVTKILKDFENLIKKEKLQGQISNISYEMLSYPTLENKKAGYQAKVNLIFKTQAVPNIKETQLPNYWHQFSMVKKEQCYEVSFVAKETP